MSGCLADFDVTHTEHAYGLHPTLGDKQMIQETVSPRFQCITTSAVCRCELAARWRGSYGRWLTIRATVQEEAGRVPGKKAFRTSQEKHIRRELFGLQCRWLVIFLLPESFRMTLTIDYYEISSHWELIPNRIWVVLFFVFFCLFHWLTRLFCSNKVRDKNHQPRRWVNTLFGHIPLKKKETFAVFSTLSK